MKDVKSKFKSTSTTDWILDAMAVVLFIVVIALIVVIVLPSTKSALVLGVIEFPLVGLLVVILLLRTGRLNTLRFSKAGIEATMAEAREVTLRARETTKEIKEFMKNTSAAVLGLVKRSGRWGGYSYDEKEQVKAEVLINLREMGISEKEIEDIEKKSNWHEYVALDYVHDILGGQYHVWGSILGATEEADAFRSRPLSNLPTPDELKEFLTKHHVLTNEVREIVEDYQYYLEHHKQRRPEVWAKRDEWYKLIKRTD
jgi:hypothetical protein